MRFVRTLTEDRFHSLHKTLRSRPKALVAVLIYGERLPCWTSKESSKSITSWDSTSIWKLGSNVQFYSESTKSWRIGEVQWIIPVVAIYSSRLSQNPKHGFWSNSWLVKAGATQKISGLFLRMWSTEPICIVCITIFYLEQIIISYLLPRSIWTIR